MLLQLCAAIADIMHVSTELEVWRNSVAMGSSEQLKSFDTLHCTQHQWRIATLKSDGFALYDVSLYGSDTWRRRWQRPRVPADVSRRPAADAISPLLDYYGGSGRSSSSSTIIAGARPLGTLMKSHCERLQRHCHRNGRRWRRAAPRNWICRTKWADAHNDNSVIRFVPRPAS